ncbi:MAG: glycosyltransferase [Planctomycetia bacterium]|nr:glycosyltransferase [Planctomycetia bacterium]
MRVAHIITRLIIGGAQENTILNCEDLIQDYGDEVLLLFGPTQGPEGSLVNRVRGDYLPVAASTEREVEGIRSCDSRTRQLWGTDEPSDALRPEVRPLGIPGGVPHKIIPAMQRAIHPMQDYRAYRQIGRALRDFKPDVVHTHSAKAGVLGRYAARKLGVPAIVHTIHGAPFGPWQGYAGRQLYRFFEKRAAGKCDAFISVADAMTDIMVQGHVAPPEKFTTIYSGMETEPFLRSASFRNEYRQRFGFLNKHIVIGKFARLFYLKGHEYVIEAAKQIVKRERNVRFLFVGDGLLTQTHAKAIADAGLSSYFVFTGLIPPEVIPAVFSSVDIIVHTSLREGLARVIPQAFLAGKPVVSYDVDGAREVVLDGETGFLLPPKDIDGLAERLIRLARDPALRRRFGEEGRRRFAAQFDHHYMTKRIREVYERLLNRH